VKLGDRDMTADWQVFPTSAWNCAIAVRPEDAAESISVTEAPLGQRPFSARPGEGSQVAFLACRGWRS